MKQTKEIKVPAKVVKTPVKIKKVTKILCDFCGATVPDHGSYGWFPNCSICGRDTCRKHNKPDPDEVGDYPEWFCQICMPLILPARREMENRHYKEEEELEARIKEESLAWQKEEKQ